MSKSFRTLLIVNPRSAGGRTGKTWARYAGLVKENLPDHETRLTERPGHATELARKGLEEGFEMVVSVGGDGTNNEVINGFFREDGAPVRKDAVFGHVPRGTGCDFARGMGIPKTDEAFKRLAGSNTVPLDVGRIDYTRREGGAGVRWFLNIAGFGANGDVVDRVNRSGKKLGGFATFLGATVSSLMSFKNPRVAFRIDGGKEEEAVVNTMFVCNGRYCGGGMCTGPLAKTDDGLFDLSIVGDVSTSEALLSGRLMYSGRIYENPKVRHERAKKVEARSLGGPVLVEADGEQPGLLPATWTILPAAVRLKVA